MTDRPRILFYVQHLLGIGHLRRAALLTRILAGAGLDVTLVSGGQPVPHTDVGGGRFVQLPPVRANDRSFSRLLHPDGRPVDDAFKAARRDRLIALLDEVAPHALMLEMYPFGRRQMRFELLPLIEAARARAPRPAILTSVRDILVTKARPERRLESCDLVERLVDRVLVHGDPAVAPLSATFPEADRLGGKTDYTGYVAPDDGVDDGVAGAGEVLVSAGGGAVSVRLLRAAIAARARTTLAAHPWRVIAGPNVDDRALSRLSAAAPEGVVVERMRADFPAMLGRCRLSISQAGYNTMVETARARAPAVLVPYAGGEETEQSLRAWLFAARGPYRVVAEDGLTPARLATAVDLAADYARPDASPVAVDGAARMVALVRAAIGPAGAAA